VDSRRCWFFIFGSRRELGDDADGGPISGAPVSSIAAASCGTDGPLLLDEEKLHNGPQWQPVVGYRLRPHVRRHLPAVDQAAQTLLVRLAQLRVLLHAVRTSQYIDNLKSGIEVYTYMFL
jgi:hypothetical protein